MKKSKIVLLYSFFLLASIYSLIVLNSPVKSFYNSEEEITGIINNIESYDSYTKLEIIGKEKIVAYTSDNSNLKLGYEVKLTGKLKEPKYKNYYLSKNIK